MTPENERKQIKPCEDDIYQAEREAVKKQAADMPPDDDKSDEGVRPDQLTSENDGGTQG